MKGFERKVQGWLLLGLVFMFSGLNAQQIDWNAPIPLDPKVKVGKLSNGLTYYVRENNRPEEKIELRLAVKAGSILEDEDQLGLAHFMEHMGFNGSENFSENELVSFLQSIGVEFGADLNAYTSFDETVYILPIPLNKPENLETAMQVLADWAFGALLRDKDIDDERGVVIEEWRTGRGAGQRMRDRYFDKLLYNSRYAQRLPIGTLEVLQNFEYESLRRFYRDWYRPNLMAVSAVGPVPQDELIALIEKYFGKKQNPANAPERKYYDIPGHEQTLVAIETDPEAGGISVQMYIKHPGSEVKTLGDRRNQIIRSFYGSMLNDRLQEIRQQPDAPFLSGFVSYGEFLGRTDAFTVSASVAPDKILTGFKAVLRENERVSRFGFTQAELDRYKRRYLASVERYYNDRDNLDSDDFVDEYVDHFLNDNPFTSAEFDWEFAQLVIPTITLAEVNAVGREKFIDENRVVIITGPERADINYPTEQDVLNALAEIDKEELQAYEEKEEAESLLTKMPTPGRVVSMERNAELDFVTMKLSNGIEVAIKKTELKNDEILMSASSYGGSSVYGNEDHWNASFVTSIVAGGGVGQFNNIELQRALAGINARANASISTISQSMNGNSTPKDFETMLQLVHLYFTEPYRNENLFETFRNTQKIQMATLMNSPDFQFQIKLNDILTQGNPRGKALPSAEELDALSLDRMIEIYKDRFGDASGFKFTFVGNIDAQAAQPLIELYLGSLPSLNRNETFRDLAINPPSGYVEEVIRAGKDDKAQVLMLFSGETPYSLKDAQIMDQLGEILSIKLIETLREEIGGVYGVGASGSLQRIPANRYQFVIQWPCAPDNVEKLTAAAWAEIEKIKQNGPAAEDLSKVQETALRQLSDNKQRNGYWLNQIATMRNNGYGSDYVLDVEKRITSVTAEDIKAAANRFLTKEQYIRIQRLPELD